MSSTLSSALAGSCRSAIVPDRSGLGGSPRPALLSRGNSLKAKNNRSAREGAGALTHRQTARDTQQISAMSAARPGGTAARLRAGKVRAAEGGEAEADPPADDPDTKAAARATFMVGVCWFFAHQFIGVGNDVIMKYVGSNFEVAQVVFLRFMFATLSMIPVILYSGLSSFKTQRAPLHIARSLLLAAGIAGYCQGLNVAPISVVTTLNFTIPLFTLVLSRVVLKELVGATRWIATLAGFAGVIVVLQPWATSAFDPAWLVVLVSAFMFASLDVLNKMFVDKESFWAMIFYTAFFTACISAYPAYTVWIPVTGFQYGLLALLGGGANLLLYCLLKSFSMVDASALAPFRYTELLLSAGAGFLFFAEVPAAATLMGALFIIPSTLLVVLKGQ